ncbi:energy-coupling factor transporter transmembrane protein EcfT [Levilactobacillus brevis]|nr:energy-coupling factor transporter transmembrane component T [Levilactobacillus brevis]MCM6800101.1 energy-coupling factor transporter transmembrane protein EcfT [Levilactobacillus brevis]MCM6801200.1 energy-coupling factor transporter transmembrane protein EcfT [Levilactobacillus brevis]MCM6804495.1 energy-coupling factor transporter transmembrane protein EcfT [Levilactobacillus brevis]MCM6808142.1 energy-coupling factor transporter transmembrane protein EcfT [Levilactobacillus brevis]MCM6
MRVGIQTESKLMSQLHPLAALIYFVALFTLLLIINHLLLTVLLFASLVGLCRWYLGRHRVGQLLKGVSSLMILIWGLNVLLNQTGPVWWQWSVGPLTFRLTKTAVLYGGTMALSLGGMILAFVWFNQIMTTPKLSYLLFPVVPRLAMLLTISLRMVHLFTVKFRRLVMLQKTRNVVVSEGSWRQRLQQTGQFLRILLIDSVSSAMETAVLMEARGFGAHKRSYYRTFRWTTVDTVFTVGSVGLFAISLYLRFLGWGWTTDVRQFLWWQKTDGWFVLPLAIFLGVPVIGEVGYRLCQN